MLVEGSSAVAGKAIAPVVRSLFVKELRRISDEVQKKFHEKHEIASTEKKAKEIFSKIYSVRKVKTLWQVDKAVDIASFYHVPKIKIGNGVGKQIQKIADVGISGNIVVLGIAGQGKSMLMRQLCISELGRGEVIPIFVELRKISRDANVGHLIKTSLELFDIKIGDASFAYLCEKSRFCLLLDGFDEIPDEFKRSTLIDIENLSDKFPALQIVLSSRPEYGSSGLRNFSNVTVCDLEGDDYKAVLLKLLFDHDPELYDEIIKKIESSKGGVKQFLTTPLMVTLLLVKYRYTKEIPDGFTAFYDDILEVLLSRHDALKPGIVRKRKSNLNDHDFRIVFERLAFKLIGFPQSISEEILYRTTKEALQEANFSCEADSFVQDLTKITCLILKDGTSYRFIHKSVPEYYCAAFIAKRPEAWVARFFKKVDEQNYLVQLTPSINFLAELDRYKWNAFYARPLLEKIIGRYGSGETSKEALIRNLGSGEVSTSRRSLDTWSFQHMRTSLSYLINEDLAHEYVFRYLEPCLKRFVESPDAGDSEVVSVTIRNLVEKGYCDDMCKKFETLLELLQVRLKDASNFVENADREFPGFDGDVI